MPDGLDRSMLSCGRSGSEHRGIYSNNGVMY